MLFALRHVFVDITLVTSPPRCYMHAIRCEVVITYEMKDVNNVVAALIKTLGLFSSHGTLHYTEAANCVFAMGRVAMMFLHSGWVLKFYYGR